MQADAFNDTRNNCVSNNCAANNFAANNCATNNCATNNCAANDYVSQIQNCHSDNDEEAPSRHHHRKEHMPIGMAYVPMQEWSEMYDACEGLYEGSAFPELNLIFCGVRGN
jgi:hypothetical protein